MVDRIIEATGKQIVARYKTVLFTFIIITLALSFKLFDLRIHHDLQDYFPREHHVYEELTKLWKSFGRDDNFLLIAIPSQSGTINDSAYIETIRKLTVELRKLDGVKASYSIATLFKLTPVSTGWFKSDILKNGTIDTSYLHQYDLLRWFVSKDGKSSLIVLLMDNYDSIDSKRFIEGLSTTIKKHNINEYYVLGRSWTEYHFLQTTVRELLVYIPAGILILAFLVLLFFSSIRVVFLVVLTLGVSIVITATWLGWTSPELPVVSPILFTIILIVTVSDIIHITHRFMKALSEGTTEDKAMLITLRESGMGVLLTSVTTATGFIALIFNPTPVIQWLGIHTAVSVMLAFLTVIFFYVPLLLLFRAHPQKGLLYKLLSKGMNHLYVSIIQRRKGIVITLIITLLIAIIGTGITRIKADTYLLADVSSEHPSHLGFSYINKHFGIGRFQEFLITFEKPEYLLTEDKIHTLLRIDSTLRDIWKPRIIASPVAILHYLGILKDGKIDTVRLHSHNRLIFNLMQRLFFPVLDSSGTVARFRLMIPEKGSRYTQRKVHETKNVIAQKFPDVILIPTGFIYVFDQNNIYLSDSLWLSLTFVVLISLIVVGIILRNLWLLIIFLAVNILPLVVLAGMMGWLEITLRATTSMLFSISFGIAVDDTTHFLSNYYLYSRKHKPLEALKKTFYHTAVAMVITTICIVSVLALLLTSDFLATRYIAIFLSITLISATVFDLIAVPVVLKLIAESKRYNKEKR